MKAALGIPAAVAVLIAFPVLVAQGTGSEEKPPAAESALTLNLEGDQGGKKPYLFAVSADAPAPTAPALLHDSSGRYRATVSTANGCDGAVRTAFANGGKRWCLQLQDVDSGHEMTGSISAAAAPGVGARTLKLTVNRRNSFWGLPFAVILFGILCGALAALLKPALKKPIRQVVLGGLLRKNERAVGSARIKGLREFARDRLGAGEDIEKVIEKVSQALDSGPARAVEKRKGLAEALAAVAAASPARDYPIFKAAAREAARTENAVTDFYDESGAIRPHPADELKKAIEELVKDLDQEAGLRLGIERLRPENRATASEALARASLVAKEVDTAEEFGRVAKLLEEARDALEKAQAKEPATRRRRDGEEGVGAPSVLPGKLELPPDPSSPALGGGGLAATRALAILITVATLLLVAGLAVATIKQANYDPKLAFASWWDYFQLFTAALGSAAAGSLVLLYGYWRPAALEEE